MMSTKRSRFWSVYSLVALLGAVIIMVHRMQCCSKNSILIGGYRYGAWFDTDSIGYVAARTFPSNHRFVAGDLKRADLPRSVYIRPPALTGDRYAVGPIAAGEVVDARNTHPDPYVRPRRGKTIVVLPVDVETVRGGSIDAGESVKIVGGADPVFGLVEAIIGDSTPKALISVAIADAPKIIPPADKKLLAIPIGKK